jgi:hypothetical protein
MPSNVEHFKKYKNEIFIETGSFLGDGIQQALDAGFDQVISIELSSKYFSISLSRFNLCPNVKVIFGDSHKILKDILPKINKRVTFWLDGHYSMEDTALGEYWSPLMQELDVIEKHTIKDHTIMIDDMRCWREYDPKHGFVERDLIDKLMQINPKYKFEYLNSDFEKDILVAYI